MRGVLAPRHTRAGWTLLVTSFLTLTFVIPGAVGAGFWEVYSGPTWWAFAIACLASAHLSALIARGQDRIVSAIFWVYVYVFLGLAPMAQLEARHMPLGGFDQYPTAHLTGASLTILVGLVAYQAGRLGRRARDRQRRRASALYARELDPRRIRLVALASLPITAGALFSLDDPFAVFKSQESLARASADTVGTSALQVALLTTPVFMALLLLLASRRSDRMASHLPLVLALVVANVVVNNPIGSNRAWFGTVAFGLGAAYISFTATQFRLAVGASVIGLTLVFPYADLFRYDDRASYVRTTNPIVAKGDYDSFQQIANGIDRVEDTGHAMGRQLSGSVLFWIPRSAWPDKPMDTGVLIAEHQGYQYTNLSAPLWIEGFTDFGLPGVVAVLYTFGRISEALERAWMLRRSPGWQLVGLAVPALAAYQMIILRGSLLQACGRLAAMVLIAAYCTRRRPTPKDNSSSAGAAPTLLSPDLTARSRAGGAHSSTTALQL